MTDDNALRAGIEELQETTFGILVMQIRLYDLMLTDKMSEKFSPEERLAAFKALNELHQRGGTLTTNISLNLPEGNNEQADNPETLA